MEITDMKTNMKIASLGIICAVAASIGLDPAIANPSQCTDCKARAMEAKQNIIIIGKLQNSYRAEKGKFANTFDQMAIGNLRGEDRYTSANYQYRLYSKSANSTIVGAKPLDNRLYTYNGGTFLHKNSAGETIISNIVCTSTKPGADGTKSANLPIAKTHRGNLTLKCAPGWKKLDL